MISIHGSAKNNTRRYWKNPLRRPENPVRVLDSRRRADRAVLGNRAMCQCSPGADQRIEGSWNRVWI